MTELLIAFHIPVTVLFFCEGGAAFNQSRQTFLSYDHPGGLHFEMPETLDQPLMHD